MAVDTTEFEYWLDSFEHEAKELRSMLNRVNLDDNAQAQADILDRIKRKIRSMHRTKYALKMEFRLLKNLPETEKDQCTSQIETKNQEFDELEKLISRLSKNSQENENVTVQAQLRRGTLEVYRRKDWYMYNFSESFCGLGELQTPLSTTASGSRTLKELFNKLDCDVERINTLARQASQEINKENRRKYLGGAISTLQSSENTREQATNEICKLQSRTNLQQHWAGRLKSIVMKRDELSDELNEYVRAFRSSDEIKNIFCEALEQHLAKQKGENYVTICNIHDHAHIIHFATKQVSSFKQSFLSATTTNQEKEVFDKNMNSLASMIIKHAKHAKGFSASPDWPEFLKVLTIYYASLIDFQKYVRLKKTRQIQIVLPDASKKDVDFAIRGQDQFLKQVILAGGTSKVIPESEIAERIRGQMADDEAPWIVLENTMVQLRHMIPTLAKVEFGDSLKEIPQIELPKRSLEAFPQSTTNEKQERQSFFEKHAVEMSSNLFRCFGFECAPSVDPVDETEETMARRKTWEALVDDNPETKVQRRMDHAQSFAEATTRLLGMHNIRGCTIDKPEERAMTLVQLELVWEQITKRCFTEEWKNKKGEILTPQTVTLYDVSAYIILPATVHRGCSFVEAVVDGPQLPTYFVSHWWGESVLNFMKCLRQHQSDSSQEEKYWICAYANNQWALHESIADDPENLSFRKAMKLSKGTLSILDCDGVAFTRLWCCYEIYVSLVDMPDIKAEYDWQIYTVRTPLSNKEKGKMLEIDEVVAITDKPNPNFPIELAFKAMTLKVEDGLASYENDRTYILNSITNSQSLDAPPLDRHPNYDVINDALHGRFALALLTAALQADRQRSGSDLATRFARDIKTGRFRQLNLNFDDKDLFSAVIVDLILVSLPNTLISLRIRYLSHTGVVQLNKMLALNLSGTLPRLEKLHLEDSAASSAEVAKLFSFIAQGALGDLEELVVTLKEVEQTQNKEATDKPKVAPVPASALAALSNAFSEGKLRGLQTLILHGHDPSEKEFRATLYQERGSARSRPKYDMVDISFADWQEILEARKKLGMAFKGDFVRLCDPSTGISYCRCGQCGLR